MLPVYLLGLVQGLALLVFAAGMGGSLALSLHNLLPLTVRGYSTEAVHLAIAINAAHPQPLATSSSLPTPSARSFPHGRVWVGRCFRREKVCRG